MQHKNVCTECMIYLEMYNGLNMDDTEKHFWQKLRDFNISIFISFHLTWFLYDFGNDHDYIVNLLKISIFSFL